MSAPCFSALQRAENSSIQFLPNARILKITGFSALQRAENSSIENTARAARGARGFSALQRAENSSMLFNPTDPRPARYGFSALQRAENSSIERRSDLNGRDCAFQCSSASRKFLNSTGNRKVLRATSVSVLFSEPKIPQSGAFVIYDVDGKLFQCSSASRKFLNVTALNKQKPRRRVSVLFSEPKIPQYGTN